jgi:small-conductance mechanosensitive channel
LPVGVARVLDTPKPGVSLNKFGADGFELELGFWITDPESGRGGVLSDVNKKIYALVQSGDIKLALAASDPRIFDAHIASALQKFSQTVTN